MKLSELSEYDRIGLFPTLFRAKVRAFSEAELLAYLESTMPPEHLAIEEICARVLSSKGRQTVARVISALAAAGDAVPSRDRATYDLRIKHLLPLLTPARAVEFALNNLAHPRKTRRQAVVRLLRHTPLSGRSLAVILNAFASSPSPTLAAVLARNAKALEPTVLLIALQHSDSQFDRALLIEAMLTRNGSSGLDGIAERYPFEFIWAVGRSGRRELLPTIHQLVKTVSPNEQVFSIYLWCLGRLQDLSMVLEVEREFFRLQGA